MADDADRAQVVNDQFQKDAIENYQRRTTNLKPSRATCCDCEEDIPLKRQIAIPGVQRCVGCQTLHENWRAL